MAHVAGPYAGDITEIWWNSAGTTAHTETAIETLLGTLTNRVGSVTEVGEITAEATNIEFSLAGEEFSSSIPGQRSPGTYDFTVAYDPSNTVHQALLADSGRQTRTFIVVLRQGTTTAANSGAPTSGQEVTYIAFDGRIGNTTISGNVGEVGTLQISIFRTGGRTIVSNS